MQKYINKKINRRQFFKAGAAVSASGALLGVSALSRDKGALLAKIANTSVAQRLDDFPVKITDKCKRFDQKYTIFARELWDYDLVKKIMSIEKARARESVQAEKGWTPLDEALDAAGWALDHKFATGSEGGRPHSQAYEWDEPVREKKVKFKDTADASKKVKKAARFLGASLVGITKYNPLWTY